jgi:hypothetical protein
VKKEIRNELYYEQILLGELPQDGINKDIYDEEVLKRLKLSNEEILKKYSPRIMAVSIKKKIDEEEKNLVVKAPFKMRKVYIPLSAAAVFLFFFTMLPIFQHSISETNTTQTENIRLKGQNPSLYIYRGSQKDAELLKNNSNVKERDLLQLSYDSAGSKYGIIFSIDGRGTVTLHFPDNIYSNTRLDFGGKVYLPYSYELDNAPFFERFFFLTSDNELDVREVMEKAGRIAKGNKSEMLTLAPEIKQQSIILFKEGAEQ